MTTYSIIAENGVIYKIETSIALSVGQKVVLLFACGDKNKPSLGGILSNTTISEIRDERGISYKNVMKTTNFNAASGQKVVLGFVDGDPSKPVALQDFDRANEEIFSDVDTGQEFSVYLSEGLSAIPGIEENIVFPEGDKSKGILVRPGAR